MRVIGLMSGTSGDGVDAALVEIAGASLNLTVKPLAFRALPYPRTLQQRIVTAATNGSVADVCHLNAVLGEWFARAALRVVKDARLSPADVDLIGSHGQTVHHLPVRRSEAGVGRIRSTLQIAAPAVIAERTGIATIADFRTRDMAAGGEGAPLTPYVHYLLLRHPRRARLIVNLGGIGNVTYLPAGRGLDAVRAFDTGPGNMVLDLLAQRVSGGRLAMDKDGRLAARGTIAPDLLSEMLAHPFLKRRPPKSTGREEFGESFVKRILSVPRRLEDVLATCALFTAMTIGGARRWLSHGLDEVVVGGGGVRNRTVMRHLASVFAPAPVRTFDDLGWDSKGFEAVAFAVLAYQTFRGECTNVPAVTGATHPVLLGSITPGAKGPRRPGLR